MNQPPDLQPIADWLRPEGVAAGTWQYVNQRAIADHYDAFVADTPLCQLDQQILASLFPRRDDCEAVVTVVDLGCGSGRTALPLMARGYHVVGIDLSQWMLGKLRDKAQDQPLRSDQLLTVRANLVELDAFADQCVDHAVCLFSTLGMIQGRVNRRKMLKHVARMVRTNGAFVVHVHNRWAALREPGGKFSLARSWLRARLHSDHEFGDAIYQYRGLENMFMHRFSCRELISDLQACGWHLERCDHVSIDGTRVVGSGISRAWQTGGFIAVARRK